MKKLQAYHKNILRNQQAVKLGEDNQKEGRSTNHHYQNQHTTVASKQNQTGASYVDETINAKAYTLLIGTGATEITVKHSVLDGLKQELPNYLDKRSLHS